MEDIVTSDWSKFGYIEIEMAKELLSHIKEIDSSGKVEIFFNTHSGRVFLSDEDLRVWMMDGDEIKEWFNCGNCGYEGFKSDYEFDKKNGNTNECCKEYFDDKEDQHESTSTSVS